MIDQELGRSTKSDNEPLEVSLDMGIFQKNIVKLSEEEEPQTGVHVVSD